MCGLITNQQLALQTILFSMVERSTSRLKEKLDGQDRTCLFCSGQQLADCLTNGLGTKDCNLACDKMGMIDIYHPS